MLKRKIAAARARLREIEEQREAAALEAESGATRTRQDEPAYVAKVRRALGVMEVRRRRHETLDARKGHG